MGRGDALAPARPLRVPQPRARARGAAAIFAGFWSAISPFIDPVTREKVVFVRGTPEQQRALLAEHFELEKLEDALGGDAPFTWDPAAYFARDGGLSS